MGIDQGHLSWILGNLDIKFFQSVQRQQIKQPMQVIWCLTCKACPLKLWNLKRKRIKVFKKKDDDNPPHLPLHTQLHQQ